MTTRLQLHRPNEAGFTLSEMMVAVSVFSMIGAAIIALNLFSARSTSGVGRMMEITYKSHVLNLMCDDIRSSQSATVQTYDGTSFSSISLGTAQAGNALKLIGTNSWTTYYYVDTSSNLWRLVYNATTNVNKKYLSDITNSVVFTSEDYNGTVISNSDARTLIDININVVDSSIRNFRQIENLSASAEIRNQ